MNVLFIVPYPSEGPSNRFRVEQYLPSLKKEGIQYSVRPFCNKQLYAILYKRGFLLKKIFLFVLFTFRRLFDALGAGRYDVVFIHREAFPFGSFFERLFRIFGKKIIYDFDDAIFLPNVSVSNRLIRIFKSSPKPRIQKIIALSDHIIAGNSYLRDFAFAVNRNVSVLPTPIDTDTYRPPMQKDRQGVLTIGWMGSSTTVKYLDMFSGILEELLSNHDTLTCLVVGGAWGRIQCPRFSCKEWRLETELQDLQSFDIGIMPLTNDDWSRGKCAFKIIEYMAVGIPVVASRVGMNSEVIQDGVNGFLADGDSEWLEKLSLLIRDRELRRKIGSAGRRTVEERYSVKVNFPKLLEILKKVQSG